MGNRLASLISVLFLVFLNSCATISGPSHGELKNSLPLMGKDQVAEVHSVAVIQFYGDEHFWKDVSYEVVSSLKRVFVIPAEKAEKALRESRKELSSLRLEDRPEFLAGLGRSLQSDAVLNGIILGSDNKKEIILQLILSRDSRILWWQAAEFSFGGGALSKSDQKALIEKMIASLLEDIGKGTKVSAPPAVKLQPKIEEQTKTDVSPKTEVPSKPGTKPKIDKKPDKGKRPDDISPM